jgi:hypothetical protein
LLVESRPPRLWLALGVIIQHRCSDFAYRPASPILIAETNSSLHQPSHRHVNRALKLAASVPLMSAAASSDLRRRLHTFIMLSF